MTKADVVDFMKWISETAGALGMSTGLKNSVELIPTLLPYVAFSVNEQCAHTGECKLYSTMSAAGKPVFNIEYPDEDHETKEKMCAAHAAYGFQTVIKDLDLTNRVEYC